LKVASPKLSFWERIYLTEVIRGMIVTVRHFLWNLFHQSEMPTVQFPEQPKTLAVRHRSRHRLTVREDGAPKCVACMCCETACPAHCIKIVAEESEQPWIEKRPAIFEIDLLRCVFCGYCVEACPEDAIRMDTGILEFSAYDRQSMIYTKEMLLSLEPAGADGRPRSPIPIPPRRQP
jgi:NADH-quinone oxidoreductase subunit I